MNWFKNRQVHNDWLESFDWGTRCLICGGATTNKRLHLYGTLNKLGIWFYNIVGWALMISALILMIKFIFDRQDVATPGGSFAMMFITLYFGMGLAFWYWKLTLFEDAET